jgi:TldD protein
MTGSNGGFSRRRFLAGSAALGGGALVLPGVGFSGTSGITRMSTKKSIEEEFGLDFETALKAAETAVSRGADLGEIYLEDRIFTDLELEDGRLRDAVYLEDSGAGLRAVLGDTVAFGYTQGFDPDMIIGTAKDVSEVGNQAKGATAIVKTTPMPVRTDLYNAENPSVRIAASKKIDLLKRADQAARKYSPHVVRVDVSLAEELRVVGMVNTLGAYFVDLQPMLRFNVSVVAQKGEKRQKGYSSGGGRMGLEYFDDVKPEDVAKDAARIAVEMLDAVPAPAGEQVVVLAPGDSGILLHEAVGHGLEADFNRKGTSKYSGQVGKPVASELCTVVDYGGFNQSRGAIAIDDEGCLPKRNVLIEKGILRGYMHDWISARHYKLTPSGNGRRQSYRHPPLPRMTNTFMLGGKTPPEEIIKSTKKGVYCKTFSGGQVNITNGDFVFQVVESYLIEEGKLTAPLKDVIIIGNGPDALGEVSMVGTDLRYSDGRWTCGKGGQRVPVGVGTPTVKMDKITVGGTA